MCTHIDLTFEMNLFFFKLNYGNNDSEENREDMGAKYCDNVTRPD